MHKMQEWVFITLFLLASFSLAGCGARETIDVGAIQTQAAYTVIAGLTQQAPTVTVIPPTLETPPATSPPLPVDTMPPPTPLPTMPPQAILADDFKSKTGWASEVADTFSYGFFEGGYFIAVEVANATIWSVRDLVVNNARIQINARQLAGPPSGYYGVTCRHQDGSNYYLLVIGSDGFYGIGKMVNGELEFIQQGYDQSGVILTSETFNRITSDCVGNSLRLIVNDQQLLEVQDDTFDTGITGMVAGTRMETGFQAQFANFVLMNP